MANTGSKMNWRGDGNWASRYERDARSTAMPDLEDDDAADEDGDWYDDFEFDRQDDATVGSIWGKWGTWSSSGSRAERVVAAQKLVQGFVNTFATGDVRGYRVAFDESVRTAGTDFNSKVILISNAPLADPTLTTDEANTILMAMAAHESSHVRYGRKTAEAVRKADSLEPVRASALKVSNILDDVRIERRFAADYPGYADVFVPAIAYVARPAKVNGATLVDPAMLNATNLMVAAVRYADHVAWTPETEAERDWWADWSTRWTRTDKVADHVAGVTEGVAHLAEMVEAAKQKAQDEPPVNDRGDGPTTDGGGSDPTDDAGQPAPTSTDPVEADGPDNGIQLPECFADDIAAVARENGANAMDDTDAQKLVEQGKSLVVAPTGETGEVYWGPKGVSRGRKPAAPSPSASASIRAAFARYRTGHFGVQKGLRSGRLDNRSITRIASSDTRLFAKRTAPSEGKYLVWLLVDCSSSMSGRPTEQAIAVGSALAAASRLIPTVRLDIWGWTSGAKLGAVWGATRVWKTGDPIANVGYLGGIRQGWTPDRPTLAWAVEAIRTQTRPGERPMILMASDGSGSLHDSTIVDEARRKGVEVVSVAIGSIRADHQELIYGKHGFIPWAGSIAATAKPLGELIGRASAAK